MLNSCRGCQFQNETTGKMADQQGVRKREGKGQETPPNATQTAERSTHDNLASPTNSFAQYAGFSTQNSAQQVSYKTSAEYADALRCWMWQYHNYQYWQQMPNWMYMTMPFYMAMQTLQTQSPPSGVHGAAVPPQTAPVYQNGAPAPGVQQQQQQQQQQHQQQQISKNQ